MATAEEMFMYRLFVIIGVIGVCAVGAGFYFGILRIGSDSAGGLTHITLTWDKTKMQEDEKKAMEKLHNLGHQDKEQVQSR
jgi:preprotein translocase subunit SecF